MSALSRRWPKRLTVLLCGAITAYGCGGSGSSSSTGGAPSGEFLDGAAFADGRTVAVGHQADGDVPAPLIVLLDANGLEAWRHAVAAPGADEAASVGNLDAVAISADNASIFAAGRIETAESGIRERGVVVAFDPDGARLWQATPWTHGASEIEAIRPAGDDLYLTGYAELAPHDGTAGVRGMLVARLAAATGEVEWSDLLEANGDVAGFTAGVSLDVSELGFVGAAGFATPARGQAGWLVGMWSTAGERLWESLRTPPAGTDLGWEGGDLNVAHAGRFDGAAGFLVLGDVFSAREGSDVSLVSHAAQTGVVGWESVRGASVSAGLPSFDEGTALVTRGATAWIASTFAVEESGALLWEASTSLFDTATGALLWETPFGGPSASGETLFDLALDAEGNVYAAGSSSDRGGVGKLLAVQKLDPAGQPVWMSEIAEPASDDHDQSKATRIVVAPDGGSWAFGHVEAPGQVEVPAVIHLDADGNLVWSYPSGARRLAQSL